MLLKQINARVGILLQSDGAAGLRLVVLTGGLRPAGSPNAVARGAPFAPLHSGGARLHPTTHRTRGGDPGLRRAWTENFWRRHPRADPFEFFDCHSIRPCLRQSPQRPSRPSPEPKQGSSSFALPPHRPTRSSPAIGPYCSAAEPAPPRGPRESEIQRMSLVCGCRGDLQPLRRRSSRRPWRGSRRSARSFRTHRIGPRAPCAGGCR